jgi:hypothetical protein
VVGQIEALGTWLCLNSRYELPIPACLTNPDILLWVSRQEENKAAYSLSEWRRRGWTVLGGKQVRIGGRDERELPNGELTGE